MRRKLEPAWRMLAVLLALTLVVTACATDGDGDPDPPVDEPESEQENDMAGEPILVGHMTFHSGAFAEVGPWFDGALQFVIDVVNESPPLGRPLEMLSQDIGQIGEPQAARRLVEGEGVEILLGPAHEYIAYRDWMLDWNDDNDAPLQPSVHGGAVESSIGGTVEEPLFRGSPQDAAQAVAAVLAAIERGAERVVLVATEIEGSQAQLEAAEHAAAESGLNVVDVISVASEQPSYRSEVARIADAEPDALLLFSQAEDGGTIVKQAAEAGLSLFIVGTTEWLADAFPNAATANAIEQHEEVWIAGFTNATGPAWDFWSEAWTSSEYGRFSEPENSYSMQYYDLMTVTALAIELGGSTKQSDWAPAMRAVAMGPGTACYTYLECVELIRAGEEIDYSGVTGEYDYTETGVVSGLFGMYEWTDAETLVLVEALDGKAILDLTP